MSITLVADIGSNWGGGIEGLLKAARKARECGANLVKIQFYLAETLALRRSATRDALSPWEISEEFLGELVSEFPPLRLGITVFHPDDVERATSCIENYAFIKTATQEWQYVALAEAVSQYSAKTGVPLFVSVPRGAPLIVGNYSSPYPITWLACDHSYPATCLGIAERIEAIARYLPGYAGFSDHSEGLGITEYVLGEVGDKLSVVEKHFCYDENLRGKAPDSGSWALGRDEFAKLAEMVHA